MLQEIEADHIPQITIFNKIDLTGEKPHAERDETGRVTRVYLSAVSGAGVELLLSALSEHSRQGRVTQRVCLPPAAGRLRALIYEHLNVVQESITDRGEWLLEIELSPPDLAWLKSLPDFLVVERKCLLLPAHFMLPFFQVETRIEP